MRRIREACLESAEDELDTVAAALTRAEALAGALRKLRAELSDLQVEAVRESLGNSNAAALRLRIKEADAALAAWRARDEAGKT